MLESSQPERELAEVPPPWGAVFPVRMQSSRVEPVAPPPSSMLVVPLSGQPEMVPMVSVELARHGGHCGFLESTKLDGYAERWVTAKFAEALPG